MPVVADPMEDDISVSGVQAKLAVLKEGGRFGDFAYQRGLEGYSEGEQPSDFTEAFPQARRGLKQAKPTDRQLAATSWLETLAAQDPGPGNAVGVWLAQALARRLEVIGIPRSYRSCRQKPVMSRRSRIH